ncbi:unnamed protein product [Rotaria socialis]
MYTNINDAELAHLYFLPKAHKQGTPLRPIVAGLKSPTTKISRWLDQTLRPLFDQMSKETSILNGSELIKSLQKWTNTNINKRTMFLTMDVSDLYTMVPQEGGIQALKKMLRHFNINEIKKMKTSTILLLARFVMQNNFFCYDGMYYKQIRGGAMGSPLTLTQDLAIWIPGGDSFISNESPAPVKSIADYARDFPRNSSNRHSNWSGSMQPPRRNIGALHTKQNDSVSVNKQTLLPDLTQIRAEERRLECLEKKGPQAQQAIKSPETDTRCPVRPTVDARADATKISIETASKPCTAAMLRRIQKKRETWKNMKMAKKGRAGKPVTNTTTKKTSTPTTTVDELGLSTQPGADMSEKSIHILGEPPNKISATIANGSSITYDNATIIEEIDLMLLEGF